MGLSEIHRLGLISPPHTQPLTALSFDPHEELIWCGNETGRVASLIKNPDHTFHRYTAFRAHSAGPVVQIAANDRFGVYSVGNDNVRLTARTGIVKWSWSSESMQKLNCFSSQNNSELLVSAQKSNETSPSLHVVDLFRGSLIKKYEVTNEIVAMQRSRLLCCGTSSGTVELRDSRSYTVEHVIDAHTGSLINMDVLGNTLITCGSSFRSGQNIVDPLVKMFDLRTLKPLPSIAFPFNPYLLKFHPKLASLVLIASEAGQFQICDIGNPNNVEFYQIEALGSVTCFDISSSGEAIAFGDTGGVCHVWAEKKEFRVNAFSRGSILPDPVVKKLPVISDDSPLSLIGMPYYTTPLLSGTWPTNMTFDVGLPSPRIPHSVLPNMKTLHSVGYAPNPGHLKRNQQLAESMRRRANDQDGPKFRSQQDRLKFNSKGDDDDESNGPTISTSQLPITNTLTTTPSTDFSIPKRYRKVEIKYSKFGIEDFDFGYYNKTTFAGLETHILNSYCNSMLQVLFFTELKSVFKSHSCDRDVCLGCELGWLFQMMDNGLGWNCQASNFLRAFGRIPQASALGLFEPELPNSDTSYSVLIQKFTRFILEQLHHELSVPPNASISDKLQAVDLQQPGSPLQRILGVWTESIARCHSCGHVDTKLTCPFVIDINYSKKGNSQNPKFIEILQQSLHREIVTKGWCEHCSKYQATSQSKILKKLPGILTLNAKADDEDFDVWRDCGGKPWLLPSLALSIQNNDLRVEEAPDETEEDQSNRVIYDLTAVVVEIDEGNGPSHLVAQIRVKQHDEYHWYLFNDFLVQEISELDVLQFRKWKVPAVVMYSRRDLENSLDFKLTTSIDTSILFGEELLNQKKDLTIMYKKLDSSELSEIRGSLCAIDAEFVSLCKEEYEIFSDGTRSLIRPSRFSLARVSVLRGEGPHEGVPFIDDYIFSTEAIDDFLTEYSGISVGDLDPATSDRPLVSFKTAYRKLRLLVDLGCRFVGHGLKKDFRTINILVPPEQVIDTVDIYYLHTRHRKLSLKFLAWRLLKQDIQTAQHDSIEDARTALELYKKYLELDKQGKFQEVLEEIYDEGRTYNFRPPSSNHQTGVGGSERISPGMTPPTEVSPGQSPPRI